MMSRGSKWFGKMKDNKDLDIIELHVYHSSVDHELKPAVSDHNRLNTSILRCSCLYSMVFPYVYCNPTMMLNRPASKQLFVWVSMQT